MAVLKIQESPPSLGITNSTGTPAAAACSVRALKYGHSQTSLAASICLVCSTLLMIWQPLSLNNVLNLATPTSMLSAVPPSTMLIAWKTSSPIQVHAGKASLPLNAGSHMSVHDVIGRLISLVLTHRP